jgi:hypothetical protein
MLGGFLSACAGKPEVSGAIAPTPGDAAAVMRILDAAGAAARGTRAFPGDTASHA